MSRQPKFRGKRTDNGEWVYGYYQELIDSENHFYWINEPNGDVTDVIPETVSQYTGWKDRNRVEIYEGGVLRNVDNPLVDKLPFKVVLNDYYGAWFWWSLEGEVGTDFLNKSIAKDCEVIGNIHDNPELMGEKK